MQAENQTFTYKYSQPQDYKFCLDSVFFAQFVAQQIKCAAHPELKVLDVCAGCGVIGFELAFHLPTLKKIDFLESQVDFLPYFKANLEITDHAKDEFIFLNCNYEDLKQDCYKNKYDLIIGNPPYFLPTDGLLTPNALKNRCRFFLDSSLSELGRGVINALKADGKCFLLVKSGQIHGRDHVLELKRACGPKARVEVVKDIRGTLVVKIENTI